MRVLLETLACQHGVSWQHPWEGASCFPPTATALHAFSLPSSPHPTDAADETNSRTEYFSSYLF